MCLGRRGSAFVERKLAMPKVKLNSFYACPKQAQRITFLLGVPTPISRLELSRQSTGAVHFKHFTYFHSSLVRVKYVSLLRINYNARRTKSPQGCLAMPPSGEFSPPWYRHRQTAGCPGQPWNVVQVCTAMARTLALFSRQGEPRGGADVCGVPTLETVCQRQPCNHFSKPCEEFMFALYFTPTTQ